MLNAVCLLIILLLKFCISSSQFLVLLFECCLRGLQLKLLLLSFRQMCLDCMQSFQGSRWRTCTCRSTFVACSYDKRLQQDKPYLLRCSAQARSRADQPHRPVFRAPQASVHQQCSPWQSVLLQCAGHLSLRMDSERCFSLRC